MGIFLMKECSKPDLDTTFSYMVYIKPRLEKAEKVLQDSLSNWCWFLTASCYSNISGLPLDSSGLRVSSTRSDGALSLGPAPCRPKALFHGPHLSLRLVKALLTVPLNKMALFMQIVKIISFYPKNSVAFIAVKNVFLKITNFLRTIIMYVTVYFYNIFECMINNIRNVYFHDRIKKIVRMSVVVSSKPYFGLWWTFLKTFGSFGQFFAVISPIRRFWKLFWFNFFRFPLAFVFINRILAYFY